jgi:hypothetical protein
MSHTPVRCEHEGIKWFPRVTIEKYSPDQSAWAERRLREELSWGRRLLVARLGVRVPRLHGDWLREVFGEPEDGLAFTQGNSLVNGGLDALTAFISGTAGPQLNNTHGICGVGSGTTAWAATQTALAGDGVSTTAWYQAHDTGYPKVDGTVHGQLDGQATVASSNGNFNWQEWCWATATGTVGANTGFTLSSLVASSTQVMFNRWTGTSLGTKGSGATWVFSSTITFS